MQPPVLLPSRLPSGSPGSAAVRGDWIVPARTAAIWATVPCPAGWAGAARSGSAPAANRAAVHAPGSCPDAGTLVTGRPEQAAAAARASSGAASISRSAPSATTARASRNRTGVVSWAHSRAAMSSCPVSTRPVTVERHRRRGGPNRTWDSTLRSGATDGAITGVCSAWSAASTSAARPSESAWRASSRTAVAGPPSTCECGPS